MPVPTPSIHKAFRTLCLLLKATTRIVHTQHKEIKETEMFDEWPKCQQYLQSRQGQLQITELRELYQTHLL